MCSSIELQRIAYWWAVVVPQWEARSILRKSEDPEVKERAKELCNRLFENLPEAAQERVIEAYNTRNDRIQKVNGEAA